MPIANPEVYAAMLDVAKQGSFAYPAINVSSSQTLNAALQGFAEAEAGSDAGLHRRLRPRLVHGAVRRCGASTPTISSAIRPRTSASNWCHVPQPPIGWWTR
jgi:hypothetical protein